MGAAELTFNTLITFVPSILLYLCAFRRRLRVKSASVPWIIALIVALAVTATIVVLPAGFSGTRSAVYSFCFIAGALFFCQAVTDRPLTQILFVILLLGCYADDISLLGRVLDYYISKAGWGIGAYNYLVVRGALLITLPPLCIVFDRYLRPMIERETPLPYWRMLWMVPASFYVLYRTLVFRAIHPYPASPPNWTDAIWPAAWVAVTTLCHFVTVRMLSDTAKTVELSQLLRMSDLRLLMQKEQYARLQDNIFAVRKMSHDLRHHTIVLRKLAQERNFEDLERYLDRFQETLHLEEHTQLCANYAVDAIAQHFAAQARDCGVETALELELPESLPAFENELCMALANLLENAVEACQRQTAGKRFIRVKARTLDSGATAVHIVNSFEGEIRRQGETFLSSKRDGEGIGIESVRSIAQRCCGFCRFFYSGGVFDASVVFPCGLPETPEPYPAGQNIN